MKKIQAIKNKKNIFIHILTAIFAISGLFLLNYSLAANWDLMKQAFETAKTYDTIIDLWDTRDAVWNEILRESASIWINENFGQWCFINGQFQNIDEDGCNEQWWAWNIQAISTDTNPPLIVRITKFLLRMTIVLSITMIIYNAVIYMIEVLNGKDRKTADAKKNLARVAGGVIIALMSVWLINLVVSIPKSSVKTSDEVANFAVWCKIWSTIIEWDELRKEVCLNSTFGHPIETMEFRERDYLDPFSMSASMMEDRILWWFRCKICDWWSEWARTNCKWKKIIPAEMKDKCSSDLWWTVIN